MSFYWITVYVLIFFKWFYSGFQNLTSLHFHFNAEWLTGFRCLVLRLKSTFHYIPSKNRGVGSLVTVSVIRTMYSQSFECGLPKGALPEYIIQVHVSVYDDWISSTYCPLSSFQQVCMPNHCTECFIFINAVNFFSKL